MNARHRYVEIKICGITRPADARAADEAGADFIGFVFYPGSPRHVEPGQAREILAAAALKNAKPVGVFVNERPGAVAAAVRELGLYAAQLHGDEQAPDYRGLGIRIWRAVRFAGSNPAPQPEDWPQAERFVVDAAAGGLYGGSGAKADWAAARTLAQRAPVMLAGGLTPRNVAEAIAAVEPLGVDVSGGVETRPGIKDAELVRAFARAARTQQPPSEMKIGK